MFTHQFRIFKQRDTMDCGIACLAMICKHWGKTLSYDTLLNLCPSSKEGVSMLGISESAKILGIKTSGVRVDLTGIDGVPLPCILYWNQNHFVVLYKVKKGRKHAYYYIADPAKGLLRYTEEELSEYFPILN